MNIKYFGEIADVIGKKSEDIVLSNNTLEALTAHLKSTYKLSVDDVYIAINHKVVEASRDIQITEKDEVAILSPFAGG
ncbi:MoaD/ThiS family protein [Bacteroidia bacterium]|nr:MoaD/ThiS family protein [Bacteroidia bacterium]MDB9882184.1 MoaD/ThiS family protein [Bacteroidia bacterium]MDC1395382.1 MoaD/ThiS family protein [Bacteroidia bacterium]